MKKIILIATFVLIFVGGLQVSRAEAALNLSGWAWSSNIGWLSFNSANANSGGGNYRVSVATTTASPTIGSFSGYAWSSNVGWVSFNAADVTGCPTSEASFDKPASQSGTGADLPSGVTNICAPRVDFVSGKVSGWVRVLSIAAEDSNYGWMHLSGTNHPTGGGGVAYTPNTGALSGYAYEPTALGWISFNATAPIPGVKLCTPLVDCPTGGGTQTCSIGTITISGNDVLIPVTLPGAGTNYSLNRDGVEVDRTKNSSDTIVDSGLALIPGTYTYQLAKSSGGALCGNPVVFTVPSTPTGGGPLRLYIGSSGSSANSSTYTTKKNSAFGLRWINNLDLSADGYSCGPVMSGSWSTGWGSDAVGNITLNTGNANPGSYTFKITCIKSPDVVNSQTVNLTITSSTVEEI